MKTSLIVDEERPVGIQHVINRMVVEKLDSLLIAKERMEWLVLTLGDSHPAKGKIQEALKLLDSAAKDLTPPFLIEKNKIEKGTL